MILRSDLRGNISFSNICMLNSNLNYVYHHFFSHKSSILIGQTRTGLNILLIILVYPTMSELSSLPLHNTHAYMILCLKRYFMQQTSKTRERLSHVPFKLLFKAPLMYTTKYGCTRQRRVLNTELLDDSRILRNCAPTNSPLTVWHDNLANQDSIRDLLTYF